MSVLAVCMIIYSHSYCHCIHVHCFVIGANVTTTSSLFVPSLVCTTVIENLVFVLYWC